MYTKVIIEDLEAYEAVSKDVASQIAGKAIIEQQHKLADFIPRDVSVWTKTTADRILIAKCKANYKKEMLKLYPHFTNKKMIVNLKVTV